jgi:hypothetical protein
MSIYINLLAARAGKNLNAGKREKTECEAAK